MSEIREKLPLATKIAFGIGSIGESVFLGMCNTFIAIFYNQAIGLSNSLIGIAIMLALIGDAISDPIMGMVSDRWRSKLGRRHPFLFAAPVPLAISLYCIFSPPDAFAHGSGGGPNQMLLFVWLSSWTILSRLFLTLYVIPHFALGGELTKEANDRSSLFSINAIFANITGALFAFAAWGEFLAGESVTVNGAKIPKHLDATAYGPLVYTACGIVLVAIFASALGTKGRIPYLSAPPVGQGRLSVARFYADLMGTLKNRNYAMLMLGFFFLMISVGLNETFNVFVSTYYWELATSDIRWFGLTAVPAVLIGAIAAPVLMRLFDRRPVLVCALLGMVIFVQLPVDLKLLGLMPDNKTPLLLPILLASSAATILSLAIATVAVLSMLGDISDQNELTTGLRQEGLIYSARTLFAKAANSAGHFVAGIVLDLFVRLPFGAVPGQMDDGVILRLGLAAGPVMSIGALIAIPFYAGYRLTRAQHNKILDELSERHRLSQVGVAVNA